MWSPRNTQSRHRKAGDEAFHVQGDKLEFTVLDYWRWANSDLLDNAARGVLAEFLVAHALKRTNEPRSEWGSFDVRTESGIRVEVKSAAYAQSWSQERPSKISFDIAPRSEAWSPETNEYSYHDPPARDSDVYVFCLLGEADDPTPDPMCLDQWKFYVLDTATLDRLRPRQKTIALNTLRSLVRRETGRTTTCYREMASVIDSLGKRKR